MLATGPAAAQVKIPQIQIAPMVKIAPAVRPVIVAPSIKMIPPSMALTRVKILMPQVQVLSVKPQGTGYVFKVKQGSTVRQVRVDGATGNVSP